MDFVRLRISRTESGAISHETLYFNLERGELARPGIGFDQERHAINDDNNNRPGEPDDFTEDNDDAEEIE